MASTICNVPAPHESIQLCRDDDGAIEVTLLLDAWGDDRFHDTLSLLSCWWLRWLAHADCRFFLRDHAWCVQCRLEFAAQGVLSQLLRDLVAIKSAVCL